MATKTKNSIPVREKTGKLPPNSLHYRKSPNPSRTTSPAKKNDQTTSEKHIPNYLKPTISSALHVPNQQGKKTVSTVKTNHTRRRSLDIPPPSPKQQFEKLVSTDNAHKPILTRRRSFNIPPSLSQQSRVSPSPILRSSSFASKTNLKAPRDDGKKRTATGVKKRGSEIGTNLTTKEQVAAIPLEEDEKTLNTVEIPKTEDQEFIITEAGEQTAKDDGKVDEKNAEVSLPVDQEPANIDQLSEAEIDIKAKIATFESPKQEPEHAVNETNSIISTESDEANPIEEVEEKEGEDVTTCNEEDEMANGSEAKEIEVIEEEKKEPETATVEKEEKKDFVVSNSNDVIEETASRLREQRKNKVKALAGAFETVISLQEKK